MKTCEEWSLEFDLLYQNITSNQAPGLVPYEKSVFLTRAQEAVVVMLYNGALGKAFESSEELTAYLQTLVREKKYTMPESGTLFHIVDGSVIFKLEDDLLFRTFEKCTVSSTGCAEHDAIVVPVTQDEFWRTVRNPFKGPNARRVLRLAYADATSTAGFLSGNQYSELVSKDEIKSYTVRYVAKPDPIILEDLSSQNLSINNETDKMTCKLPEVIHQTILTEAVKAAKAVWASS